MASKYYVSGYTPPAGVDDREKVKNIQTLLGVTADGVWGAKTQAAYESAYAKAAAQDRSAASVPQATTGKYSGANYIAGGGPAGVAPEFNMPLPISSAKVKNAAYAVPSSDASAIRQMQHALAYYVPGLSENGVYDAATAKAFEQYGNRALYSTRRVDQNGRPYTDYGVVQSGNAVSPWQTEEQRRNANNAHLARYRLSGEEVYPLYDPAGNKLSYGSMGHDGMGGVFDPEGYSSNPYFLMANAGVSREQLRGAAAQASDKAIKMALEVDPFLLGNDLYVTNGGGVSSGYTPGSISVNAIRAEIAGLRGLASEEQLGMGKVAEEIPKPDYYVPAGYNSNPVGGSADSYTQLYNTLAGAVGGTGMSSANQDAFSYYYDLILSKLGGGFTDISMPTYSAAELSSQYASYLRPRVDSAIAARGEAAETNRAELDADAAARGMGSSTFVSSLKNREADAAASDIAGLEGDYLAVLSERVQEGMMAQLERQQELYLFRAKQQAEARNTALSLASDWYFDYMDRQQELELARLAAEKRSSTGSRKSSEYTGDVLTYGEYEEFVNLLTAEEREKLRNSNGKTWSAYRKEMQYALGEDGFDMLLRNAE